MRSFYDILSDLVDAWLFEIILRTPLNPFEHHMIDVPVGGYADMRRTGTYHCRLYQYQYACCYSTRYGTRTVPGCPAWLFENDMRTRRCSSLVTNLIGSRMNQSNQSNHGSSVTRT
jgi:hypothetical protein